MNDELTQVDIDKMKDEGDHTYLNDAGSAGGGQAHARAR